MQKNYKQIKFFILNIIRILLAKLLNCLIKRDKNIFLFSCNPGQTGDIFLHNTKYFYLYLNFTNKLKIKTVWLTNDNFMLEKLNNIGLKDVYTRNSLKGIYYALKAKYWFTDYLMSDTTYSILSSNAVGINFWHGTGGLKKSGQDDIHFIIPQKESLQSKIYNILRIKDTYFNVDSEHESFYRKSAQGATDNQIVIKGSPRLDVLFKDFPNAELFMEEEFNYIKILKQQGKKLFFYVPTFRETQKDISSWLKSPKLAEFLSNNNVVLVCKLHPFDKNSLNFDLNEHFYKMNSQSDLYSVLKYMDVMISDYSSVYFDYLLLDRPILYYVPDLEEYQEKCRGFYAPYETLTAGAKVKTEDELLSAMQDVIDGRDNYKEDRKRLRDQTFKYQDGKNCERVIDWIKSLG